MSSPAVRPELFAEFDRRMAAWGRPGPSRSIDPQELPELARASGTSLAELFDAAGAFLALRYHSGALDYVTCDAAANYLWSCLVSSTPRGVRITGMPDSLFYAVYRAFDAGEYHRKPDRPDNPEADYTRPSIRWVIDTFGLDAEDGRGS